MAAYGRSGYDFSASRVMGVVLLVVGVVVLWELRTVDAAESASTERLPAPNVHAGLSYEALLPAQPLALHVRFEAAPPVLVHRPPPSNASPPAAAEIRAFAPAAAGSQAPVACVANWTAVRAGAELPAGDVYTVRVMDADATREVQPLRASATLVCPGSLASFVFVAKSARKVPAPEPSQPLQGDLGGRDAWLRRWLRRWALLLGGTKWIDRDNALEQETRRRVYEYIRNRPGAHAGEIADALRTRRQTVLHHLRILLGHRYVTSGLRGRVHYYATDDPRRADPRSMLRSTAAEVVRLLDEGPRTPRDLAAELGITPRAVTWHLRRLRAQGLVRSWSDGRRRLYVASGSFAHHAAQDPLRGGADLGIVRHHDQRRAGLLL